MAPIVILGSGIIGIYTSLIFCRQGRSSDVKVIAKYLPGDMSIEYTSPTAGGNFSGISGEDPNALEFDRLTYRYLFGLLRDYGPEAGLEMLPATDFFGTKPSQSKIESLKSYVKDFEEITDKTVLAQHDAAYGWRYTTFNFYCPKFLKFLYDHLRSQGVTFERREVSHIREAFDSDTKVVFNCTGVMAEKLGGVADSKCYPVRGQVIVVKAPHVRENRSLFFTDGRPPTYIIPRPHSGGRVVLGGFYQKGNYTPETFGSQTASILDRTTRLMPELLKYGPFEIIDERAGLRPGREGGARVEKEIIEGKTVIHNYGAAGTGYQAGLGMAIKAVKLYLPESKL